MKKLSNYDQELFEEILTFFTSELENYMSEFDFVQTGQSGVLDGLFEFYYIKKYEFADIDENFYMHFSRLEEKIECFVSIFSHFTTPLENGMFCIASTQEWKTGATEKYRQEANQINDAARAIYDAMITFKNEGKKRMAMAA